MFSRIVFVLGIFLTMACGKEDGIMTEKPNTDTDNLTIVESHLDFTALGGKDTVVVEANKPVEASSNREWASVTVEGKAIIVTVEPNNTISDRTAALTITAGEATKSVEATQGIAELEVPSSSPIIFMEQGGRRAIEVQTNLKGQYQVAIEDNWLTYQIEGDSLVLTAPSSELKREAKVSLSLCGRTVELTVKQIHIAGYYLLNSMDLWEENGTFEDWKHPKSPFGVTLKSGEEKETYILNGRFPANEYSILCSFQDEKLVIHAGQQVGKTPVLWNVEDTTYFHLYVATRSTLKYYNNPEASYVAPLVIDAKGVVSFTFTDGATWTSPVDGIAVKNSSTEKYPNHFFKSVLTQQDTNPNPNPDPNPGEGGTKPLK